MNREDTEFHDDRVNLWYVIVAVNYDQTIKSINSNDTYGQNIPRHLAVNDAASRPLLNIYLLTKFLKKNNNNNNKKIKKAHIDLPWLKPPTLEWIDKKFIVIDSNEGTTKITIVYILRGPHFESNVIAIHPIVEIFKSGRKWLTADRPTLSSVEPFY